MASFTIPTYFTAVDKFSGPVRAMAANMEQFAIKSETVLDRAERGFRKLTPSLNNASKEFLSFASAAAVVGGVFMGVSFGFNAIKDYESNLAELRAITGATGNQFEEFEKQIRATAEAQKMSSVDVAKAFTIVGNAQPALLQNAKGLSEVSNATITLAKASRMELAPAADALTVIMNQYSHGSEKASKDLDMLAAGSRAGSMEIVNLSLALKKFGTVANSQGISLNESIALAELGSRFDNTEEAGVRFRNILLAMSTIKIAPAETQTMLKKLGINFDIVSSKTLPLSVRLKEMSKVLKDSNATAQLFEKQNVAMATGILGVVNNYDDMLKAVDENGVAAKMAAENTGTLEAAMKQVSAAFTNMLVSSDSVSSGLNLLKGAMRFLAENMGTVTTVAVSFVSAFVAIKLAFFLARAGLIVYNIYLGIYNALTMRATVYTASQTVAMNTQIGVTKLMTAAQWALNFAMEANPIGLVVLALTGLALALYNVIQYYQEYDAMMKKASSDYAIQKIGEEKLAVLELASAYQKKGMSMQDAQNKALEEEGNRAVKRVSYLQEIVNNDKSRTIQAMETQSPISTVEANQMNINSAALNAALGVEKDLEKEGFKPKRDNSNLTHKFEITVNASPGTSVSTDDKNVSVVPKIGSTMSGSFQNIEKMALEHW